MQTLSDNILFRILHELPDAVTYMKPVFEDSDGRAVGQPIDFAFVFVNARAAALLEMPQDLAQRTTIMNAAAFAEERHALLEQYTEVFRSGKSHEFTYYHARSKQTMDILRTPFYEGVLSISRDRAAQQLAERELVEKNEQLENTITALQRSNESLERFAYVASHDLQEPLRKLLTYSDMLYRRYKEVINEDGKTILDKIADAGQRMDKLIRDLLDYSRFSDKANSFEIINLNEILAEVIADLETSITQAGAIVNAGELPPMYGSKFQMRQLLQNLISNSIKFAKKGVAPQISIKSSVCKGKDCGIPVFKKDLHTDFLILHFSDNGIGFEPLQSEKIFEIFHRLHGRIYPGNGIGLSIVKKVVEQHHGYIVASGEKGVGAKFTILLPATA